MFRAYAGIVAPIFFFVTMLLVGAARPGYDPVRNTISELGVGPNGALQLANFWIYGLAMIGYASTLGGVLRPGAWTRAAISTLTLVGLGAIGCGLFLPDAWPPASWRGEMHLASAMLVFLAMPMASASFARAAARDGRWRGFAGYSLATAAANLLILAVGLATLTPPGQPRGFTDLHLGLIERVDVTIFLVWQCAIAVKARRIVP